MIAADMFLYPLIRIVRLNVHGDIDFEAALDIARMAARGAADHHDHSILLDFRDTVVTMDNLAEVARTVLETVGQRALFGRKIAAVIPPDADAERMRKATTLEAHLQRQKLNYRIFKTFEAAIDWIAELRKISVETD